MVWHKRHRNRKQGLPQFEEIEPRILYSADLAPGAETTPAPEQEAPLEQVLPQEEITASESTLIEEDILFLDENGSAVVDDATTTGQTEEPQPLELIFIDASVPDYETLIDGITDTAQVNYEIFILDAGIDGFSQIQSAIGSLQNISAVHFITHGDESAFQLGNTWINSDNFNEFEQDFKSLSTRLTGDADLLFYGCNIAENDNHFLDTISQWTGADVAASTDLTGHTGLGGDWALEYQRGSIESSIVVSTANQLSWNYALDTTSGLLGHWTFDSNASDSTANNYDGVLSGNANIDTSIPTNQVGTGKLDLDGSNDYVDLSSHAASLGTLSQGTIAGWINTSDSTNTQAIFGVSDIGDTASFATLGVWQGKLFFDIDENGFYDLELNTNQFVADGNWHHVAVTVDGSGNSIFIDGVQIAAGSMNYWTGSSATTAFFSSVSNVDAAHIGVTGESGSTTWDFNGLIDDLRIYNRALSTTDISELYANLTPLHTIDVTTTSDVSDGDTSSLAALNASKGADGEISLREAIIAANNTTNTDGSTPDEIHFDISDPLVSGAHTINLSSALDTISDAVIIDGTTDSDFATTPIIELDGSGTGSGGGFGLAAGSDGSTIRGFVINNFSGHGITISSDNNTVAGNYIGTDVTGTSDQGNTKAGIILSGGASGNTIGGSISADRNLISGNGWEGVNIQGAGTDNNQVSGNYIGTDASGTLDLGNSTAGVLLTGTTNNNQVGGNAAGAGNLIAYNDGDGVYITSGSGTGHFILGNSIHSNALRGIDLSDDGISYNDSDDNDTGANNLLNFPVLTNVVQNGANLDIDFDVDLPAGNYRIEFFDNASGLDNLGFGEGELFIGFTNISVAGAAGYESFSTTLTAITASAVTNITTTATEADGTYAVFASTSEFGPQFDGAGVLTVTTTDDTSDGDTSSIAALLGNHGADGKISLREAILAANNTANIGGNPDSIFFDIATSDSNYSAGTNSWEIQLSSVLPLISGVLTLDATTQAGYDGTPSIELDGSLIGGGSDHGFASDTDHVTIRGFAINDFSGAGIHFTASGDQTIESNYIGTDITGTLAQGNNQGIYLGGGADNVIIGGTGVGNLVSGNTTQGIYLDSVSLGTLKGNLIGTDITGTIDLGNGNSGVRLHNATNNIIGGSSATERNTISGNDTRGIYLSSSSNNTIQGNYIGTNAAGSAALGNVNGGIRLSSSSANNTIGGTAAGEGNVLSGNADGIYLQDAGTTGNTLQGNYIGTDATGLVDLGNTDRGIQLESGANENLIGGTSAGARNVISGNDTDGIILSDGASPGTGTTDNLIQGNYIGVGSDGSTALGNGANGIRITTVDDNLIGGATTSAGNIIANNTSNGIVISTGVDNSMLGNTVYNNGSLGIDLGFDGVTANDLNDGDSGPNNLQNHPTLTQADLSGTNLTVSGTLDTDWANTQYRIEFFGIASGDADTSNGEARYYLGTTTLTTDGVADGTFSGVVLSGVTLTIGDYVTATATKIDAPAMVGVNDILAYGNSSELAINVAIASANTTPTDISPNSFSINEHVNTSSGYSVGTLTTTDVDVGDAFTYTLIGGPDQAKFSIGGAGSDELILTDGTLDFESQSSYSVTVRTTDAVGATYSESVTVNVNDLNDAPTITDALAVGIAGTDEDSATAGTTVTAIINNASWADEDSGAIRGMAITAQTGNGIWQYSTDAITWTDFGTVSSSNALLLNASTNIRYVGDGNNGEIATFDFRAWDTTSGTASSNILPSYANPGAGGGSSAYSSETSLTTCVVSSVNDAPVYSPADGIVTTAIGAGNEGGEAVLIQPDGKIVVGGYTDVVGVWYFALARYNPDGSLDTSFGGGDGSIAISLGGAFEIGLDLTMQADGKFLLAGTSNQGGTFDFAVARYNADGTLDTAFGGGDGIATTPVGFNTSLAYGVDIQADGKILLSGMSNNGTDNDFSLIRYNTDGTLDTTFGGGDGIVITAVGIATDQSYSLVVQPDGKILQGGLSYIGANNDVALTRYNSDGTLDTSFGGGDGIVTTDILGDNDTGFDIALQADGKVLLTGSAVNGGATDIALVRYNANGTVDTSFGGGDGIVTTAIGANNDIGENVTVQADGNIIVTGTSNNGTDDDIAVVRYLSDGTLDTSFGGTGIVTVQANNGADLGKAVALQSDGKIVVTGNTHNGVDTDYVVLRIKSDGSLDTDFGDNALNAIANYTEDGAAVPLDDDVTLSDVDLGALNAGNGNYAGASLVLVRNGGANAEDVFSFNDANGISLSAGNLIKNSQVITSFDTTSVAGQLTLIFTDANGETPTLADINNIQRQVTYANSSDNPPASVQIDWLFDDGNIAAQGSGGALTAAGSSIVLLTAANDAPVITSNGGGATGTDSTAENSTAVTTITATDVDLPAPTFSYSIIGGADQALFTLTGNVLTFTSAPDYDVAGDSNGDNIYEVIVQVSDGNGGTDTQTLNVTVTDINEAPTANAGGPYTISEGGSLTLDASASSDPDNDTLTVKWDLDNDGNYGEVGEPTTSGATVSWATLQSLGYTDDGSYTIGLQIDDGNAHVVTTTTTLTINNTAPTISTTGNATVDEDAVYTLNLGASDAGDDTITGWIINWGDGNIETFVGNPASVTHTYVQPDLTYNILASVTDEDGTFHQNQLLIPAFSGSEVLRFEPSTGTYLQTFAGGNGLFQAVATIIGPDGNLYVSGYGSHDVQRFDAATGAYIDTFIAAGDNGLVGAAGLAFGPDGNLYVADYDNGDIYRYNGTTGVFIDKFVTKGTGGLNNPEGILFGQDGKLYVSDYDDNEILRFDAYTGAFIDTFVSAASGGLSYPEQMTFGPDGNLYVASYNDTVLRYDGTTGAFIDQFVTPAAGGLRGTTGVAFGPDGHLYASSHDNNRMVRFDGTTGALIDVYIPANTGGLNGGYYPLFLPQQQVTVTATNDAPVATISPLGYSVPEDDIARPFGGVSISDIDAGTNNLSVTLSVSNGKVDLGTTTGLTVTAGSFNSASVTFEGTLSELNAGLVSLTYRPDGDFNGSDTLTLTVDDQGNTGGGALTDSDTATITVNPANDAPVVTAAQTFSVSEAASNSTSLGNAVATDIDGATTFSAWSITGGNSDGIFAIDASSGEITVADNTNLDFDTTASYTLSLTVSDGTATSAVETVAISITDVPTAITSSQSFSIAETAANGSAVGSVATTGDTPKTFAITAGNTGTAFAIDNSGNITVADTSAIDYETLTSYTLTIQASDGTTPVSETLTINITNVNENGVSSISDTDGTLNAIAENAIVGSVVGITAFATDSDVGDSVSYSLSNDAGGLFSIDSNTGVVTVANALDYESATSHNITVLATSDDTSTSSQAFTIAVTDINDNAAVITAAQSFSISELAANSFSLGNAVATDVDTSTSLSGWTITGGNSDGIFAINAATGEITITDNSNLDFDTTSLYTLSLTVSDGSNTSAVETISISVTDASLTITAAQSFSIAESATNGSAAGAVVTTGDVPKTFSITAGNTGAAFAIDNNGTITVADTSAIDYESLTSYTLTIQASDGTTPVSETLIINITNVSDTAPSLDSQTINLAEDATVGTNLLDLNDSISGSDVDGDGDPLSYSLIAGNADGLFAIDPSSGVITLVDTATLDYESSSSYILQVEASDGAYTSSAQLTIQIINVNEAPMVSAPGSVTVDEDIALGLDNVSVSDPDSGASDIEVTVTSTHGVMSLGDQSGLSSIPVTNGLNSFVLSGSASAINQALSGLIFTPDANFNGDASVSVVANDLGNSGSGAALSDAEFITITVMPVNDEPALDVPDLVEIQPGESIDFSTALDNLAPLQDLDSLNTTHNLSLSIAHATLSISDSDLLSNVTLDDGYKLEASGDIATINQILNALVITPEPNFTGELTLDLYLEDEGSVEVGSTRTLSTQIHLYVPLPAIPEQDSEDKEVLNTNDEQSNSNQLVLIEFEESVSRGSKETDATFEEDAFVPELIVDMHLGAQGQAVADDHASHEQWLSEDAEAVHLSGTTHKSSGLVPFEWKNDASDIELMESLTFTPPMQGFIDSFDDSNPDGEVSLGIRLAEISGAGFVVGSLVWLLKGSSLLSSLLVSYPAWRGMDPLPVLMPKNNEPEPPDQDDNAEAEKPKNHRFELIQESYRKE